jgi:hypothetical protein
MQIFHSKAFEPCINSESAELYDFLQCRQVRGLREISPPFLGITNM